MAYTNTAFALAFVLLIPSVFASQVIGSATVHAPAVIANTAKGALTVFTLNVTRGNGSVIITGPSVVGESTLQSARSGVYYATRYLGINESGYDFIYNISDRDGNVSGPSGGLAFSVLAIAALSNRTLIGNFTLTGTVDDSGNVGPVGGVYEKALIAAQDGMRFVIVPYEQNGTTEHNIYYIVQNAAGIPLVQVANVSQALSYAFGRKAPAKLGFPPYQDYYPGMLPPANLTCTSCNIGYFQNLTNFTFNYVQNEVGNISGEYPQVKSAMSSALSQYRMIASSGYYYTGADLSFLMFLDAYMYANSKNVTDQSVLNAINSTEASCSALAPPQMNTNNYEYVVGGEIRQAWANLTISQAIQTLNQSSTEDYYLAALRSVAAAGGWCAAAGEMYSMANAINGTPVEMSQGFDSMVGKLVKAANKTMQTNLYVSSALSDYAQGQYAASLYNLEYANAFYGPGSASTATGSGLLGRIRGNMGNATYGIWPQQFATQALFYLNEANLSENAHDSESYIQTAYTISELASYLSGANREISLSFVQNPSMAQLSQILSENRNMSAEIANLTSEVSGVESGVTVISGMLFVVIVLLMVILLRQHDKNARNGQRR